MGVEVLLAGRGVDAVLVALETGGLDEGERKLRVVPVLQLGLRTAESLPARFGSLVRDEALVHVSLAGMARLHRLLEAHLRVGGQMPVLGVGALGGHPVVDGQERRGVPGAAEVGGPAAAQVADGATESLVGVRGVGAHHRIHVGVGAPVARHPLERGEVVVADGAALGGLLPGGVVETLVAAPHLERGLLVHADRAVAVVVVRKERVEGGVMDRHRAQEPVLVGEAGIRGHLGPDRLQEAEDEPVDRLLELLDLLRIARRQIQDLQRPLLRLEPRARDADVAGAAAVHLLRRRELVVVDDVVEHHLLDLGRRREEVEERQVPRRMEARLALACLHGQLEARQLGVLALLVAQSVELLQLRLLRIEERVAIGRGELQRVAQAVLAVPRDLQLVEPGVALLGGGGLVDEIVRLRRVLLLPLVIELGGVAPRFGEAQIRLDLVQLRLLRVEPLLRGFEQRVELRPVRLGARFQQHRLDAQLPRFPAQLGTLVRLPGALEVGPNHPEDGGHEGGRHPGEDLHQPLGVVEVAGVVVGRGGSLAHGTGFLRC